MGLFKNIINYFKKVILNHKIRSKRRRLPKLYYVGDIKKDGNYKEEEFYNDLNLALPKATIYRSVCLDAKSARGEIDFIIIYDNKVFLLELKGHLGYIYEENEIYYQDKESYIETFTKEISSPIRQINHNLNEIKKRFNDIYFEKVLYFPYADEVELNTDINYFNDFDNLINFIKNSHNFNIKENINYFKNNIILYDRIIKKNNTYEVTCIINDESLEFISGNKKYKRKDIKFIKIIHYRLYDDVILTLKDGTQVKSNNVDGVISFKTNGKDLEVGINKINTIKLGF